MILSWHSPCACVVTNAIPLSTQINDDIFAYHFYVDKDQAAEAEAKRLDVVQGWARLKEWIASAELSAQLTCLHQFLVVAWDLS